MSVQETANCTDHKCHACGVCTELDTHHSLAEANEIAVKINPFVKQIFEETEKEDNHPSLYVPEYEEKPTFTSTCKIRFEFQKIGDLKFISHLDLISLFCRAARRAKLKVAYSEGFHPKEKISLALSLSLFTEGHAEIGEIELAESIGAEKFMEAINRELPKEVQILRAKEIGKHQSLGELIARARYRAYIPSEIAEQLQISLSSIEEKVKEIEASESLLVTSPKKASKKKFAQESTKTCDIRPGVFSLKVINDKPLTVEFEIAHGSTMHVKPIDLLKFIGFESSWRIARFEMSNREAVPLFDCC